VGWQHCWAGLGAYGGASASRGCQHVWATPLADSQHFAVYACGLNMLALQIELLSVQAGPASVPLLHVGMLPYHTHQRHFFVSNLPRSAGSGIEGGSLQVAGEQPTVACLVCEQQRGRAVGNRWNTGASTSRAISWPVMLPSNAAATVDWTASQCSYRPKTVADLAA
jgi:hypothetical protein